MFRNWGFLLSEMWFLILLAALLGLLAGWLIFARREKVRQVDENELDACRRLNAQKDKRILELTQQHTAEVDRANALQGEVAHLQSQMETDTAAAAADLRARLMHCEAQHEAKDLELSRLERALKEADTAPAGSAGAPAAVVVSGMNPTTIAAPGERGEDYDGDGILEGKHEGQKPQTLTGPRDGTADDLKQIKGIGPKLEQLCNRLGFYHFDQIALWTRDEVAWVDANLEGFKGRVSRDAWVDQAKVLAAGGTTEFSKRVEDGDVY